MPSKTIRSYQTTKRLSAGPKPAKRRLKSASRPSGVKRMSVKGGMRGMSAAQLRQKSQTRQTNAVPASQSRPRSTSGFSSSNTAGGILVDAINAPREIGEFLQNLGKR